MAGITQQVPNYIFGISEQPDELKIPGQVKNLKNGLPDVTRGLQKRPGSRYVNTLSAETDSKWFHIFRDEAEQYIGQVTKTGEVKVWDVKTGAPLAVTGDQKAYLAFTDSEDIQVLSINDYTFMTNRREEVKMSSTESPAAVNQAFISLKQIKPGTQYALDISTPGSAISTEFKRATNIEISGRPWDQGTSYPGDGDCEYSGRQLFNQGNTWWEIDSRCLPGTEPDSDGDLKFYDVYTDTATLKFGGENSGVGATYNVTMRNSKKDGGWQVRVTEAVEVKAIANIALVRPAPTPFEGLGATADSILTGIANIINKTSINCRQIGSGLYLEAAFPFVVSIPDSNLMEVIQDSADDVSKLPSSCKDGYIVKVANSGEEEDDYWVKFIGDNGDGPGVWEETIKPGIKYKIDANTMPVQLVRQSDGTFSLGEMSWEDRLVGDDNDSVTPTFIGQKINKLVFFRNRLGVLTGESIVMARPGEFTDYNFFPKTATTVTAIDPIDLSCSSRTPVTLTDAIEANAGLVLFSENQQFIMTTDSDVFSARTAKINALSSYNYNVETSPVSLGTTIAFLNNGGNFTRFFEMTGVTRETEPQIIEQSKLVSKLLPINLNLIADSKENTLIALANKDTNEVWVYRYFNTGEKRVQSAWMRWEMTGNVQYHCIMNDVYYPVVLSGGQFLLQTIDVRPTAGNQINDYRVYMDNMVDIEPAELTYDADTLATTFTKPEGFPSDTNLSVFTLEDGNNTGRFEEVTPTGDTITIEGNWTDTGLTLGYLFEMLVAFPTIYPQQKQGESVRSDVRSSLIVHRVKLNLEDAGVYESTLTRKGKPDYVQLYECREQDGYKANSVAFAQDKDQTIPVYERNTNIALTLTSSHPSPCTLISMNWEGDYNPRYYKSV